MSHPFNWGQDSSIRWTSDSINTSRLPLPRNSWPPWISLHLMYSWPLSMEKPSCMYLLETAILNMGCLMSLKQVLYHSSIAFQLEWWRTSLSSLVSLGQLKLNTKFELTLWPLKSSLPPLSHPSSTPQPLSYQMLLPSSWQTDYPSPSSCLIQLWPPHSSFIKSLT